MPLRPVTLPVKFFGGLETKLDDKVVPLGKFLELRDAVFTRGGTAAKRYGNEILPATVLGSASPLPTPLALGKRDDELLAFSADEAYSHVPDVNAWVKAGDLRSVIVNHQPVAKTGTNQTLPSCAVNSGVLLVAWEDSAGGIWYSLLDSDTKRALVAPTQADTLGSQPRCIAVGNFLHLYYARVASRELICLRFEVATPTGTPVGSILTSDLYGTVPVFDIDQAVYNNIPAAVITWATPYTLISIAYVHESGELGSSATGLPAPTTISGAVVSALAIAFDVAAAAVVVAWTANATNVRYRTLSTALATLHAQRTVASPSTVSQLTVAFDGRTETEGATIWVFYEAPAAATQDYQVLGYRVNASASTFTTYSTTTQRGCALGSKAFKYGTDAYVHLVRDSTLFRTYFTQRARDQLVIARFLPGLGAGRATKAHLPSVWPDPTDGGVRYFAATYVADVESPQGDVFGEKGVRKVDIDFDSDEAFRSAQLGATTYIAGGLLYAYDGQRVVEAGFHYGLDDLAAPTQTAPTGEGIAAGTRNYVFVLENVLGNGEVERGPLSPPVQVEIPSGANKRCTFTLPTYRLTAKPRARIAVYRSEDGDSSTYARVSSFDPLTVGAVNGYVANSTTSDTVTFIDEMTDEELLEQEPLYTNGGIVENDPLGGARFVTTGKNRVFTVDRADPLAVYFSQELSEGYAAEFSPALRITVDPYGGPITGLVVLDDLLVIFKETAIFGVGGPGPLANPDVGGGWTLPALLTSDVGCISADSIGYTPVGVVFQSKKGIYLLGRDRSVRYIGAGVEKFTDPARDNLQVAATTLIEDRHEIRLLMTSGESLLYDYQYETWSSSSLVGRDAILVGGRYHHLRSDGAVWRETIGAYRDSVTMHISHMARTPHITLGGLLSGFQRIWRLVLTGEYRSAHTLRVRAFFDFEAGHDLEWVINPADFINLPGYGMGDYGEGAYGEGMGGLPSRRYQIELDVFRLCESVQFTIEFIDAEGVYGAAGELTEMVIHGGAVRDRYPQVAARRA